MRSNEVSSLISLLDDADSEVASEVMHTLCARGEEVLPMLESAWFGASDKVLLARIEQVMAQIQDNLTLDRLAEWVKSGAPDTLSGAYYVTKLFRPNAELSRIRAQVSALSREVWLLLRAHLTAPEQVYVINHVIYRCFKFSSKRLIDSDRLLLFSDLLQNKEGCQLSLGLLYCCVAEELSLPITGIGFAQSAMLGYVDQHREGAGSREMLFFIDPHSGELCGVQQLAQAIIRYIAPRQSAERYLAPCTHQAYVLRYARILCDLYQNLNKPDLYAKANRAVKVLSAAGGVKVR